MKRLFNTAAITAAALLAAPAAHADGGGNGTATRYPSAKTENFAPTITPAHSWRNMALHRPCRASSTFDFNLTPQLLTDGIAFQGTPPTLAVTTPSGLLPKREREWAIDGGMYTRNTLMGSDTFLQYEWTGAVFEADTVALRCNVAYDAALATQGCTIRVLARENRRGGKAGQWSVVAQHSTDTLPGQESRYKAHSDPNKQTDRSLLPTRDITLRLPLSHRLSAMQALRVEMKMPGAAHWTVYDIELGNRGQRLTSELLSSARFASAWVSEKGGEQWAEVDLGRSSDFSEVRLQWIEKAAEGRIETSDDRRTWTAVGQLHGGKGNDERVATPKAHGRYVRVVMTRPGSTGRYALGEMQVMGNGGYDAVPHAEAAAEGNRKPLSGGDWKLQRASEVKAGGGDISRPGFADAQWITATVPGTALMSYVNIGALPDPALADNIEAASESFFNSDFWYRRTFNVPDGWQGKHVFLCFDGINWKADVYVNGKKATRIEGAFTRSRTDITPLLRQGGNVLAVKVECPAHPGGLKEKTLETTDINGGMLGADNPTFHASIGWDWISTVRGRETGLWNDVFLSAEGEATLSDPLVTTSLNLPDTAATITPRVVIANNENRQLSGTLRGWVGDITFEKHVTVAPNARSEQSFSPDEFAQLRGRRMRLWWPNGYGDPFLHEAGFEFTPDNGSATAINYRAGIRQVTYSGETTRLQMQVNGKRVVPLGGNWGFSEQNLLYRKREYDIAVAYHRLMNFNMIRNWVCQTGDEEFYDACDRNGIMVWQDFWLANPADGPDPDDNGMFMRNAADFTARMRKHPCIAIYCGRNEGYPPAALDSALRTLVEQQNPGMLYISSSADEGVSGHGPYWAEPANTYFAAQTGKLHTERGMPAVMTYEGLCRTFTPDALWPQSHQWGQHDFTMRGAQRGATFNAMLQRAFGKPADARQFATWGQWINYDGYRAMFESGSKHRQGLLIWMSHPCWPSMVWQCYDYWLEPTAAFFACKKACEPLHIQWNALTHDVEVVNILPSQHRGLTARRDIFGCRGNLISTAQTAADCPADTTLTLAALHTDTTFADADSVHFVRLALLKADGSTVSENTYALATGEGDFTQIAALPRADIGATVKHGKRSLAVTLHNNGSTAAVMTRLNLVDADGQQILPAFYSDNYFHLMPGERREVKIEWLDDEGAPHSPHIEVSAFNADKQTF